MASAQGSRCEDREEGRHRFQCSATVSRALSTRPRGWEILWLPAQESSLLSWVASRVRILRLPNPPPSIPCFPHFPHMARAACRFSLATCTSLATRAPQPRWSLHHQAKTKRTSTRQKADPARSGRPHPQAYHQPLRIDPTTCLYLGPPRLSSLERGWRLPRFGFRRSGGASPGARGRDRKTRAAQGSTAHLQLRTSRGARAWSWGLYLRGRGLLRVHWTPDQRMRVLRVWGGQALRLECP
mmetsp:Transcript_31083/g.74982  ORF Transcript_31083/g.74982 Transcript_31083/m.74982 type:complete len:241 (+) Transcript_31083:6664-7386(+)